MGMFGSMGAKRAPFDFKPQAYGTPGIGDGLPGATPMGDYVSPETRSILDNTPAAKPGFGARDVVGIIGDALSAMGGGQGVYTQMKLQDRQRQRMLEQAQIERQNGMSDWLAKQNYEATLKAQYPDYTEFQKNMIGAGIQPGSSEWGTLSRQKAENDADKFVNFVSGGNTIAGPWSQVAPMLRGGDQISPPMGGAVSPPTPPSGPGVPHLTVDQMRSIGQGVNFAKWQQREGTPVLVTSAEEMARVPVGTMVISPDGRRGVKK